MFVNDFECFRFLYVVPTLLRTYSNHLPNPLVCKAIQFVCKQFYILHRKPFMLQVEYHHPLSSRKESIYNIFHLIS